MKYNSKSAPMVAERILVSLDDLPLEVKLDVLDFCRKILTRNSFIAGTTTTTLEYVNESM